MSQVGEECDHRVLIKLTWMPIKDSKSSATSKFLVNPVWFVLLSVTHNSRTIPYLVLQRRGCASLCPNGSLATGQGTRFVLAATEHLHRRIAKLSSRIRQLEDALAGLQAKHSAEPHPLLHNDLVGTDELREGLRDEGGDSMDDSSPTPMGQTGEVIDALGTLSISDHGISRFFGPTGGSEVCHHFRRPRILLIFPRLL